MLRGAAIRPDGLPRPGGAAAPLPISSADAVKSHGRLQLAIASRGDGSFLARDTQSGCLRARMLFGGPGARLTIASINTAGGLTGGDRLDQEIRWEINSAATITSPAAEKIYRSLGRCARVAVELRVAAGAEAEWLPQETILFDGGRLERSLVIHLDGDASLIACDGMIFGRLARGERVRDGQFIDVLKVYREGRLVLFDRTDVAGDLDQWLGGASAARGHRAAGMILIAATGEEQLLTLLQAATEKARGLAGATLVRGLIHVRLLGRDDVDLRHDLALFLSIARARRPLPRSWSC